MIATVSDVRAMSDEEIRVKVAELCGYTFKDEGSRYPDEDDWQKYKAVYRGEGFVGLAKPNWIPVPNYPADLNAMHEAEKILTASQDRWLSYQSAILQTSGWRTPHSQARFTLHSTARQRAEAFVLTMLAQ